MSIFLALPQPLAKRETVTETAQNAGFRKGLWVLAGLDGKSNGAQKRTRTSTSIRTPAPEAGASTNSAIWARYRQVARFTEMGPARQSLCVREPQ